MFKNARSEAVEKLSKFVKGFSTIMASVVLEPLIDYSVQIAIFALDQALQLFFVTSAELDMNGNEEQDSNRMDKVVIYNKLEERGLAKYINVESAADTAVKQIQHLSTIFESADFSTSLDYLSDAWRALSGNNFKLFQESIDKAYSSARSAKTKITKNPNHLLGVYSVIIFCGFCKFSEFGKNTLLGLRHIKDTLNEMGAGTNRQS